MVPMVEILFIQMDIPVTGIPVTFSNSFYFSHFSLSLSFLLLLDGDGCNDSGFFVTELQWKKFDMCGAIESSTL
jgi:hypothetical protein